MNPVLYGILSCNEPSYIHPCIFLRNLSLLKNNENRIKHKVVRHADTPIADKLSDISGNDTETIESIITKTSHPNPNIGCRLVNVAHR